MVVRYRADRVPAIGTDCVWHAREFDWPSHQGRLYDYDYVFVRHDGSGPPAGLVNDAPCDLRRVKSAGAWMLIERGAYSLFSFVRSGASTCFMPWTWYPAST